MALSRNDLIGKRIVCRFDTLGGPTYYIGNEETSYRCTCFRPIREEGKEDQYCSRQAGYGTENQPFYEGACKYHGGNVGSSHITVGRYARVTKKRLKRYYEVFEQYEDSMLDLTAELTLQRTLLAAAIDMYEDSGDLNTPAMLLRDVVATVERIEKIQNSKVLTEGTARLMMAEAITLLMEYVGKERVLEFVERWRSRVSMKGLPSVL